ncbi:hypothetical protein KC358_g5 [Hortaea werneckii]|nr:hypothetical protein KC358_g5 [Hortaea werneckii]
MQSNCDADVSRRADERIHSVLLRAYAGSRYLFWDILPVLKCIGWKQEVRDSLLQVSPSGLHRAVGSGLAG